MHGQPVVLRYTDISKEELEKLQQGQTIPREYLVAEPQIAREPGKTEPKWPIAIFAVVGLMARYDITKNLSASANLNNVFDREYLSGYGLYSTYYYGDPRNLMLGMKYRF